MRVILSISLTIVISVLLYRNCWAGNRDDSRGTYRAFLRKYFSSESGNDRVTCSNRCCRLCRCGPDVTSNLRAQAGFYALSSALVVCRFACNRFCPNEKRSTDTTTKTKEHWSPMPLDFDYYDIFDEGKFNETSLAALYNNSPNDADVILMIASADDNDDGYIDSTEFATAPWLFEGEEKEQTQHATTSLKPLREAASELRDTQKKHQGENDVKSGDGD